MSYRGDFRKIKKRAEDQGWTIIEGKETWRFYPPRPMDADRLDARYQPCRIGHTPSSQRTWVNFLKCLNRKGLR